MSSVALCWWSSLEILFDHVYYNCCIFISALLNIPPAQFKLVLDSIIWAFKHTMRNVADTGLDILYTLLQNIATEEAAVQSFYQTYFTDILQHLFSVITDSSHTAG
jgi:exportin-1